MKIDENGNDQEDKIIDVTITMTITKNVKVSVSDYELLSKGKDEDGDYYEDIDYSGCDIKQAVKSQILLPTDVISILENNGYKNNITSTMRDALHDWKISDIDVDLK